MAFSLGPSRALLVTAFAGFLSGCLLDASAYSGAGTGGSAGSGTTGAGAGSLGGSGTGNGGSGAVSSTGGATSAGGTTGGTTSAGGTTTTTTTTTTTSGCSKDSECPDPLDPCLGPKCNQGTCGSKPDNEKGACGIAAGQCFNTPVCKSGVCTPVPKDQGIAAVDGMFGDCKRSVCDGNGGTMFVPDDNDAPFNTQCANFSCDNGDVVSAPKNEGGGCLIGGNCCTGKCCTFNCTVCL